MKIARRIRRERIVRRTLEISLGLLVISFLVSTPASAVKIGDSDAFSHSDSQTESSFSTRYAESSGYFSENLGQIPDTSIRYYARMLDGYIGLATDRISVWTSSMIRTDVLIFDDSQRDSPQAVEMVGHSTNYFLGDRGTFTDVKNYRKVLYSELWPGVDLLLTSPQTGVACELRIEDGIDCTRIADSLDESNSAMKSLIKHAALTIDRSIQFDLVDIVCSQYRVQQDSGLLFSMFLGGSDRDQAKAITRDGSGNLYITGLTSSLDFPVLNELMALQGDQDVFVTKINQSGGLVYSTYIGGSSATVGIIARDEGADIAVDVDGNAYVTGNTRSDDFPTVNAWDPDLTSGEYADDEGDAFLLKLNSTGNGIIYSTYFGGGSGDQGTSVVVDNVGNAYMSGSTRSDSFPLMNPIYDSNAGMHDGFIMCLSAAGDSLLFSTFLGGTGMDAVDDLALDSSGNLIATGYTGGGLSIIGQLFTTHAGGSDAFVVKIDSSWQVVYSTYLGGDGNDRGESVCVDDVGNVYVTGWTESANFPIENEVHETGTYDGAADCFVTIISETGSSLLLSTLFGGSGSDIGTSISVDVRGNVFIAGETASTDFPTSFPTEYEQYSGGTDAFILKMNLNYILYSTYVGGSDRDVAESIAVDSYNNTYICGYTRSADFPGPGLTDYVDGFDGFVFGIHLVDSPIRPPTDPSPRPSMEDMVLIVGATSSVVVMAVVVLFIRKLNQDRTQMAMDAAMDRIADPDWNYPGESPDGAEPIGPEPDWNYPGESPDGAEPIGPEPDWNYPG
ncbi:MAG: SBBP repeat-containing protein, partial [Candidatus Thorarchaeota archaeon]